MHKRLFTFFVCAGFSACIAAPKAEPAPEPGKGVMSASASAVGTTVSETYHGFGAAVRSPLHDLNMMQEAIPVALIQAKDSPYDTAGLTSCEAITAKVEALDLALGPDVDTPKIESMRSRSQRLASAAADSALNAAKGALDHYIPVRGILRQVTGARKYEKEVSRAVLAGSVRRGFLKALGMQQNCFWPAAPIGFKPAPVAPGMQIAAGPTLTVEAGPVSVVSLAPANGSKTVVATARAAEQTPTAAPAPAAPAVIPPASVLAEAAPQPNVGRSVPASSSASVALAGATAAPQPLPGPGLR